MTTPPDLTEARRALQAALGALLATEEYLSLHARAQQALTGTTGQPALHQQITTAITEAHNALDRTDPAVADHPTDRCVQCGSAKITYRNHEGKPWCTVCANGRGPTPPVMPHSEPHTAAASPYAPCPRCGMPHNPDPTQLPEQICAGFFLTPELIHADGAGA